MPASRTRHVGIHAHQASSAVADVAEDYQAEVVYLGALGTRQRALQTLIWKLPSTRTPLIVVSEADRDGDRLSRNFTKEGQFCCVVAPSRIPTKAGERVNSPRRDAILVTRSVRSGALTPVATLQVGDDAICYVSRAREDMQCDLKTARHGRTGLLLRYDLHETGRATWGPAHLCWPRGWVVLRLPHRWSFGKTCTGSAAGGCQAGGIPSTAVNVISRHHDRLRLCRWATWEARRQPSAFGCGCVNLAGIAAPYHRDQHDYRAGRGQSHKY